MRLWHYKLIPHLPRQQLLGQHRECCALRGKGWGRKHSTVDYVFRHNYLKLSHYHKLVIEEMLKRKYKPNLNWKSDFYRGQKLSYVNYYNLPNSTFYIFVGGSINYPEHNDAYLDECIENLKNKGIIIDKELL